MSKDYSDKSSKLLTADGSKALQRLDTEDRTTGYRLWRREIGKTVKDGRKRRTPYTSDLDQIEYIFVDDVPVPVGILELTRFDMDENDMPSTSWMKYRNSVWERFFLRDAQGRFITMIAKALNCQAWIVLFRHDLQSFWLFNMLDQEASWIHKDASTYQDWLVELRYSKQIGEVL